jgi:hypothetical protein
MAMENRVRNMVEITVTPGGTRCVWEALADLEVLRRDMFE